MSTIYDGVALDFGSGDLAFTTATSSSNSTPGLPTAGSLIVSDFDVEKMAKVEPTSDAGGNTVNRTYFDKQWKCTWRGVVKGSGLANALTQSNLPEIGTLATSSSTNYPWLASLVFTVEKAVMKKTNTKNNVLEIELLYTPNITTAASA
jgi:hypothetical protein